MKFNSRKQSRLHIKKTKQTHIFEGSALSFVSAEFIDLSIPTVRLCNTDVLLFGKFCMKSGALAARQNYLYLRFLAASDFFLRLTLGLSYCSLFFTSVRTPERWHCLLNLRRALSSDSFSLTLISAIIQSLPSLLQENFQENSSVNYIIKQTVCQALFAF